MKAERLTEENGYRLVSVRFTDEGLKQWPRYVNKKVFWVVYLKKPRRSSPNSITVWWEGLKTTQNWHRDFFILPSL